MKTIGIFAVAVAVISVYGLSLHRAVAQSSSRKSRIESPFYCNRNAIKPEDRARKEELNNSLWTSRRGAHELENGYEFELPSDPSTVKAAAEWAELEKLCCPFFDIDLRLERENGPFCLRLTGREGVKQFIRSEFARWFQAAL